MRSWTPAAFSFFAASEPLVPSAVRERDRATKIEDLVLLRASSRKQLVRKVHESTRIATNVSWDIQGFVPIRVHPWTNPLVVSVVAEPRWAYGDSRPSAGASELAAYRIVRDGRRASSTVRS
jgi:hypothetical protein